MKASPSQNNLDHKMASQALAAHGSGGKGALSVEEARARIAREIDSIGEQESVPLRDAQGRILARDILAPFPVPPHTNSAMDGYAIISADLRSEPTLEFTVTGTAWAGRPCKDAVQTGQAIRIMTGAVMPEGADAVLMQEHVHVTGDTLRLDPKYASRYIRDQGDGKITLRNHNVRAAGEDLPKGALVLPVGRRITPADLGLLASLGLADIPVYRRLRVALLCTGDELRPVGAPLEPGAIYDSNRYTLHGMLSRLGVEIHDLGVIPDRIDVIRDALTRASNIADVVLATGGVSVGEADHVETVLRELGRVHFQGVAIKPGHPLTFGRIGGACFFGLPGNPVAVMVCFYQFVRFTLARMAGETNPPEVPIQRVPCLSQHTKKPGRAEFVRGILETDADGNPTVRKTGNQGSGILHSMSLANCFIVLAAEQADVAPGDLVAVQAFWGVV